MNWFKQFVGLFVAVLLVMFIIYILRRVGKDIPVVGDVVSEVFN